MYDPETPWVGGGSFMEEMVSTVINPGCAPARRTVTWKDFKQELKSMIRDYYEKYNKPIQAHEVFAHLLKYNKEVNVTIDFKLLVILLNNLGGITVYSHPSELHHRPLL